MDNKICINLIFKLVELVFGIEYVSFGCDGVCLVCIR